MKKITPVHRSGEGFTESSGYCDGYDRYDSLGIADQKWEFLLSFLTRLMEKVVIVKEGLPFVRDRLFHNTFLSCFKNQSSPLFEYRPIILFWCGISLLLLLTGAYWTSYWDSFDTVLYKDAPQKMAKVNPSRTFGISSDAWALESPEMTEKQKEEKLPHTFVPLDRSQEETHEYPHDLHNGYINSRYGEGSGVLSTITLKEEKKKEDTLSDDAGLFASVHPRHTKPAAVPALSSAEVPYFLLITGGHYLNPVPGAGSFLAVTGENLPAGTPVILVKAEITEKQPLQPSLYAREEKISSMPEEPPVKAEKEPAELVAETAESVASYIYRPKKIVVKKELPLRYLFVAKKTPLKKQKRSVIKNVVQQFAFAEEEREERAKKALPAGATTSLQVAVAKLPPSPPQAAGKEEKGKRGDMQHLAKAQVPPAAPEPLLAEKSKPQKTVTLKKKEPVQKVLFAKSSSLTGIKKKQALRKKVFHSFASVNTQEQQGRYFLQLLSTPRKERAEQLRLLLAEKGIEGLQVSRVTRASDKRAWFRLRLNGFKDRNEAKRKGEELQFASGEITSFYIGRL